MLVSQKRILKLKKTIPFNLKLNYKKYFTHLILLFHVHSISTHTQHWPKVLFLLTYFPFLDFSRRNLDLSEWWKWNPALSPKQNSALLASSGSPIPEFTELRLTRIVSLKRQKLTICFKKSWGTTDGPGSRHIPVPSQNRPIFRIPVPAKIRQFDNWPETQKPRLKEIRSGSSDSKLRTQISNNV